MSRVGVPRGFVVVCFGFLSFISVPFNAPGENQVVSDATNQLFLILDPYVDVKWDRWEQHKASFHTHTMLSDGLYAPDDVIDLYKAGGYDILALTDHDWYQYDRCTWPWTDYGRDADNVDMLAIPGMELSYHHHTLSLFSEYKPLNYTLPEALAGIGQNKGLAVMCHPSLHWPGMFMVSGLQTPLNPALRAVTRGDFSVETWFKTEKAGRNILLGSYTTPSNTALNLELYTENRIRVYIQSSSRPADVRQILVSAGSELGLNTRDGAWHHLAATRDNDTLSLYLDGRLAGQIGDAGSVFDLEGEFLFIGRDQRTGDTLLNGSLDNTRVWERSLASNEVYALATGLMPGDSGGPLRDALLLEYLYETSDGFSIDEGNNTTGLVDDTSCSGAGPFHAVFIKPEGGRYVAGCPLLLMGAGGSGHAVNFPASLLPRHVPDEALDFYIDLFAEHTHLAGMEIFNGNTTSELLRALDEELWDDLLRTLMPRRPVWGWAVDDMHAVWHYGKGWMVIPAAQRTERRIRAALERGAYYFCTTYEYGGAGPDILKVPRINRIIHDELAGTLTIEAEENGNSLPDTAYCWIADGEEVYRGAQIPYRSVEGISSYVRAEVAGDGGKAFTNPFGFMRMTSNQEGFESFVVNGCIPQVVLGLETGNLREVTAYLIYRSSDGIEYEKVGLVSAGADSWEDGLLPGDGEYIYAVAPVYEGIPQIHSTVRIPCRGIAYQDSTGEGLPDYWKKEHGFEVLCTNGRNGAGGDPDGDGMNNLQEYIAGTDPQDSSSQFAMAMDPGDRCSTGALHFKPSPTRWGRRYILQRKDSLTGGEWENVVDWTIPFDADSAGNGSVSVAPLGNQQFYRLEVEMP